MVTGRPSFNPAHITLGQGICLGAVPRHTNTSVIGPFSQFIPNVLFWNKHGGLIKWD